MMYFAADLLSADPLEILKGFAYTSNTLIIDVSSPIQIVDLCSYVFMNTWRQNASC